MKPSEMTSCQILGYERPNLTPNNGDMDEKAKCSMSE